MTSRASRTLMRSLKGRFYGTQTAAREKADSGVVLTKQSPKVTKLPNGLIVASLENYSPIARVAVVANAGSRFESGENQGVNHCLRVISSQSTRNSTSLGNTRSINQTGGSYSCTSTREYMIYNTECMRDDVESCVNVLRDVTTAPAFKPWEVNDVQPQLGYDLAVLKTQPNVKLFELLHEAAFRTTLGRSLYAPDYMVGKYTPEQLMSYVQNFYTSGRMALVGVGVDHDNLCAEGSKFTPYSATGVVPEKAVYHGGELRLQTGGPLAYVAVATEGPSLASKDMMAVGVLQMVMGTGPYVKYGSNIATSRLGQAVSQATGDPFAISCINANYTDAGLFGFCAVAQPQEMEKVLKAAFAQFASITKGIKDQEVERAKNQMKAYFAMELEENSGKLTSIAEQALGSQQVTELETMLKMIDNISTNDVMNVAKKIVNGKASMAAVGELSNTPYLDQLYK